MALSGAQVAQLLYQAGFRGEDLVKMTGIGRRESGYNPAARRTDNPGGNTGDFGLFQINSVNWNTVRNALGLSNINQLLDPLINARAAKVLFDASGYYPWGAGPGGWTAGGNPLHGVSMTAAQASVDEAGAQGLLGTDWQGGGGGSVPDAGAGSVVANSGGAPGPAASSTVELPSDAKIYVIDGTMDVYAVFDQGAVKIAYKVDLGQGATNWADKPRTVVSQANWDGLGVVNAGSTGELGTVSATFGTFGAFWTSIISRVMGFNNPASHDPEVLKIIAEFAARPDMTAVELQNKLQATAWFQGRTQSELEWNSVSEEERNKRREETAAKMIATYQQFGGAVLDRNDPRVVNYLEQVASGKMGFGAFTEIVKRLAAQYPESPYSRDLRNEQEAQRQRPIDIENTSLRIRQTLERWGVDWTNGEVGRWAKDIMEKTSSDDDLMTTIKQQAQVLYPWKDPELETLQAAQPWLSTYERVMEQAGGLSTPKIQAALTKGAPAWEFEQELKKSSEWLGTRNARDTMYTGVANIGRRLGFE